MGGRYVGRKEGATNGDLAQGGWDPPYLSNWLLTGHRCPVKVSRVRRTPHYGATHISAGHLTR